MRKLNPDIKNPKLEGSGIIECIPQIGNCPNECLECYYNGGGFFTNKKAPLIPTLEEASDKIVRVNSGHDSNLQKELVLKTTEKYPKKFYNTSIPNFEFPAPVVFTCNGRDTDFSAMMVVKDLKNVMMVRFRANLWNFDLLDEVVSFYTRQHGVPVTITFMRYTDLANIPPKYRSYYEMRKSILNFYYSLSSEERSRIVEKYPEPMEEDSNFSKRQVGMCGTLESSYCKDCLRCIWAYDRLTHQNQWLEVFNSISGEN